MTQPILTVITPVYKPVLSELEHCLYSVRENLVEHILVLDGRLNATNFRKLKALAKRFAAKLVISENQSGISAASNLGASKAQGEFLVFVDQDDFLEENWSRVIQTSLDNFDFIYSNSYIASKQGKAKHLQSKPGWSPTRLIFNMYACHFMAVRKSIFDQIGGFRPQFDGSQDHDLALRVSRLTRRFHHIPLPLYNWRQSDASTASNPENKSWAFDAGLAAAQDHLDGLGVKAKVEKIEGYPGALRAVFATRVQPISIVVPTSFGKDNSGHSWFSNLIHSLEPYLGTIPGDELVIVSEAGNDDSMLTRLASNLRFQITHIVEDKNFNFSRRCNIGFLQSKNEHVLLLNDDVEFGEENPLDQLFGILNLPNVGLVGGLLTFGDFSVQHGGHTFIDGLPGHLHYKERTVERGIFDLVIDHEVVGVTGALMFLEKSTWRAVGGFNEALPLNYNDVDFCLKIRTLGFDIIQANTVKAIHHESMTRKPKVKGYELNIIKQRWPDYLSNDVFSTIPK